MELFGVNLRVFAFTIPGNIFLVVQKHAVTTFKDVNSQNQLENRDYVLTVFSFPAFNVSRIMFTQVCQLYYVVFIAGPTLLNF